MKGVRFSAEARKELLHEVRYYEAARPGTGSRFRLAVEAAAARALAFPESGIPSPAQTRRILVKGFPFSIVYEPTDGGVFIHAVAPGRKRPEYWVGRVKPSGRVDR